MSMFQSTATVTSIFSVRRSRPVERCVSVRAVSWMLWTRPTRKPR